MRMMLRGGVGRLVWGVRPGRVGSRVSWQRLCQTTTPAPAPEPAKFSRALLGGTLRYTGVSVGLACGWLMGGGHKQDELLRWFAGLGMNIAALASAAKYNTSVGWASGSTVYGKHIRDVGGILLVMAQAALGKYVVGPYVVGPIVGFSGAALLWTAVAAGIVDRQHLKKVREMADGVLEEAEPGAGKGSEESFREFEESNFEESFRKFDKDGNGVIDRKELRAMIHHLYQQGGRTRKPSDTEIAHFMKMADIDGDGKIDYEEFVLFMKKLEAAGKRKSDAEEEELIKKYFREFDKDGNGVIDREEFRAFMKQQGAEVTDKQVAKFMKMADIDGNGKIDFEEFALFMKKLGAVGRGKF